MKFLLISWWILIIKPLSFSELTPIIFNTHLVSETSRYYINGGNIPMGYQSKKTALKLNV